MRRIGLVFALALTLAPLAAEAQAGKIYRIAFLGTASSQAYQMEALRAGLHDLGYFEGKNIVIEYRGAGGRMIGSPTWRPNWCVSR